MDVGTGIIHEKIFEIQLILCRSEVVPEKGIWGAIFYGGTQDQEREWGQRRGFWGDQCENPRLRDPRNIRTGCQC